MDQNLLHDIKEQEPVPKLSSLVDAVIANRKPQKFTTLTKKLKTTVLTRATLRSALHTALWVVLTADWTPLRINYLTIPECVVTDWATQNDTAWNV